ncbi:MAG: hypothetical protein M5R42_07415 [Rhodocyclaceae bacterium]|nr:hypothetical protein [Rhodocyclaceae bacterium]
MRSRRCRCHAVAAGTERAGRRHLRREAAPLAASGRERLVFAPRGCRWPSIWRAIALPICFSDTLPCNNAHTTASDALWAGLPVC